MSCITVQLGFSDTQLNSCKGYYQSSAVYYTDFLNFAQVTKIYSDSSCLTFAPQGYYSNGVITRYWDPAIKQLLKATSCQLPMIFNPCCDGLSSQTFLVSNANFVDQTVGAPYSVNFNGICYRYSNVLSNQSPVATFTNYQYKDCQSCLDIYPCIVTPTPTPSQTPTPSAVPTSIYLKSCCDDTYYYSLGNISRPVGSIITIKPYNYCYSVISDNGNLPSTIPSINDYQWENVTNCSDVKCQPCSPQPTSSLPYVPAGQTDPCFYSTVLTLGVECNVTQPNSEQLYSGILDLNITGGTPPYYVVWTPGGVGKTIYYQGPGVYTAVVTDVWRDFTATTTCVLSQEVNCGFSPNVTEYFIPTPTPTPTPTVTVSQTNQPTNTPTPSITSSMTPTPSMTPTLTKTPTPTVTKTPTMTPSSSSSNCGCYTITNTNSYNVLAIKYYNCNGVVINLAIPPNSYGKFCGTGVTTVGQGTLIGACDGTCTGTYPNT